MASYTRQSTFSDGDLITAALFNDEYNQLLSAFENTTGHKHDGTVGEGPVIGILGDAGVVTPLNKILIDTTNDHIEFWIDVSGTSTQQLYIADGAIVPVTDNDIDLGTSSLQFKDLYINGTANIDSLVADTADINGGTIDGTIIGGTSAAAITGTTITGTSFVIGSASIDETELEILDGATLTTTELNYVDGVTSSIQTQIDTKAPLASPSLTGIPTAPTAASNTNTTQIATTAYVQTEITELIAGAPGTLDTLNELAAAINDDANYNTTLTTALATKLPLAGGTMTGDVTYSDNVKAQFGTSNDLQIYHDGSNSIVQEVGTGDLRLAGNVVRIRNSADTENMISAVQDGAVTLSFDGNGKLSTTSTGVDVTGTITADALTVDDITINGSTISDGGSITIDTEGDFIVDSEGDVYLDAAGNDWNLNSAGINVLKVTNTSGDISIKSMTSDKDLIFKGVDGGSTITALTLDMSDAGKALFNAGANFGSGIDVTGTATMDGLSIKGNTGLLVESNGSANYGVYIESNFAETMGAIGALSQADAGRDGASISFNDFGRGIVFKTNEGASNSEAMRIDSSQRVGIGTNSPAAKFDIYHGSSHRLLFTTTGTDNFISSVNGANSAYAGVLLNGSVVKLGTGGTERARIDGSGNLLIGKTVTTESTTGVQISSTAGVRATVNSNVCAIFNRKNADGDIALFRKDGTTVGSIGAESSKLNIGNGDTGIEFNAVQNAIIPHNQTSNANVDNSIDLGFSSLRFKDLHLAGTANFGSLSDGTITITGFADEDDMSSNSATLVPTQQSVKAYVDSQVSSAGGTGISFADDEKAKFGDGLDLEIYHDGSNSFIKDVGTGDLIIQGSNAIRLRSSTGENMAIFNADGAATLQYDNSTKLQTSSSGINVTGVITTDGLTTSADINFGDDDKAVFGAGSDLQIYHTSADNSSYIRELGAGNLKILGDNVQILNAAGTENQIFSASDGGVYLYHNGVAKFETTSSGIDVTGTVTSDGLTVDGNINKNSNYNITQFYKADGSTRLAYILFRDDSPNYFEYNDTDTQPLYFINNNKKVLGLESNSDISFYNTAGTSQALFFDASTERLGIGTTSPNQKLEIKTTSGTAGFRIHSDTTSAPRTEIEFMRGTTDTFGGDAYTDWKIGHTGSNQADFAIVSSDTTRGTNERVTIEYDTGNVGIGTDSPVSKLSIENTGSSTVDAITLDWEHLSTTTNIEQRIQWRFGDDATADTFLNAGYIGSGKQGSWQSGAERDSYLSFGTTNDNTQTEKMRISADGLVGIGTDSPTVPLTVNNQTDHSDIAIFHAGGGTPNRGLKISTFSNVNANAGVEFDAQTSTGAFKFSTGGTERMRLTSTGLGIGATPSYLLDVRSSTSPVVNIQGADGNSKNIYFRKNTGDTVEGRIKVYADIMSFETGGSEAARIDASGRVGIGVTSPSSYWSQADNLVVGGTGNDGITIKSSTTGNGRLIFTDTASSTAGLNDGGMIHYDHTSDSMRLSVNGSEAMRIDSSGNVIIANSTKGLNDTDEGILFSGALPGLSYFTRDGGLAGSFSRLNSYGDVIRIVANGNAAGRIGSGGSGALSFYNGAGTTENMRIDSSGNVNIATGRLRVALGSDEGSQLNAWSESSGEANLAAYILKFKTGGNNSRTERMRLDSSGNLLVGTTSYNNDNAGIGLGASNFFYATRNGNLVGSFNRLTSDGNILDFRKDGSTVGSIATTSGAINLYGGSGTNGITVDSSGNLTATGNVTAFSDERLKENIETLQGSKVLEMRGVSYTKDGEVSSGVIAQEIEKVAPELVHTAKDEIGTKSVAYGNLVGYLIEAIKDQQKQIDDLKERLDNGTS